MKIDSINIADIAKAFLQCEGMSYKVVQEQVYRYDATTGVWRLMSLEALKARIQTYDGTFEGVMHRAKGSYLMSVSLEPGIRDKVADYLVHMESLRDDQFFETAPRGLAVRNGFVVVDGGSVRLEPHNANFKARSCLNVAYDSEAVCPKWTETLREAMREVVEGEDENAAAADNKARLLQEFAGAAIFGFAPRYSRCLIASGGGNNGKSTILQILSALVDESDRTSTPPQMWEKEYYAAQLHDKKLNSVGELPAREIMTSSVFKQVVTGEPTQARHPHGRPFVYRPIAAHIFACNSLPATGDYTEGYWRRFLVVKFARRFDLVGEVKGALTSDDVMRPILENEMPGLLNWAIEGAVRVLKNNGYSIPEQHYDALTEWRTEADPVLAWADSALMVDDEKLTPFADLYSAFAEWAATSGHKQLSTISLGRRLAAIKGAKSVRRATGKLWNVRIKPRTAWTNVPRNPNMPPMVLVGEEKSATNS